MTVAYASLVRVHSVLPSLLLCQTYLLCLCKARFPAVENHGYSSSCQRLQRLYKITSSRVLVERLLLGIWSNPHWLTLSLFELTQHLFTSGPKWRKSYYERELHFGHWSRQSTSRKYMGLGVPFSQPEGYYTDCLQRKHYNGLRKLRLFIYFALSDQRYSALLTISIWPTAERSWPMRGCRCQVPRRVAEK